MDTVKRKFKNYFTSYHYFYDFFSCYLNPGTKFIWALIVPVVVIILINIGFFIMAATIMWRHRKERTGKMDKENVK